MKKYLFLLLILFQIHALSQMDNLTLSFSAKFGVIHGSSFGKFVTSYNKLNFTNKTPLTNFGSATGWSLNGDWWLSKNIFMGYYQHTVNATATSHVNDNYTREFHLRQKSWGMDFGGGAMSKQGGVVGFFGIYFATANISADFKFRDGYRSLGAESNINGIYHGFGFSESLGAKGFFFAGPIGLTACVRWCPISGPIEMTDFGKDNTFAQENLPEDLGNSNGKYVMPKFQSFFLDLGIAFKLQVEK